MSLKDGGKLNYFVFYVLGNQVALHVFEAVIFTSLFAKWLLLCVQRHAVIPKLLLFF